MSRRKRQRGVAAVLAMIVLAMFAVLGVAHIWAANSSLVKTDNLSHVHRARMQAESGLEYFTYLLTRAEIPAGATGQELITALGDALPAPLNTEITDAGSDHGFTATLTTADNVVTLAVLGRDGGVQRTISMNLNLIPGRSGIFGYAAASNGSINMSGNAKILGANNSSEADVFSASAGNTAFTLSGSASIDGDIYSPNPGASAQLSGKASIGGEDKDSNELPDHIHVGIEEEEFPEVDSSVFEPFATTVVNASTPTSGGTFNNIRIAAGANPNFSGNTTINGVIFIEQPNKVTFSGTTNITGVIVTQDAGDNAYNTNTIKFSGNTTLLGVNQLPDEYAALKNLPGSALLAPGFGVEFSGNFGTINGTMAADEFKFTGNAGGTVQGSLICYGSAELNLSGNSTLTYDRSSSPETPAGFVTPPVLVAVPSTYREH